MDEKIDAKIDAKRYNLFKLMRENPDLPVLPMVDGEIAADESGYWIGSWGSARIDEYLFIDDNHEIAFKSEDDMFYVLERYMDSNEFDALPEDEEECRPYYDKLPWKKAIIVYINRPDPEEIGNGEKK